MRHLLSSKALTDIVSLTTGELAGKVAGFLAFTYLARILTPETYGGVELAISLLALFAIIVDFGFGPIGAKSVTKDPQNADRISSQILAARVLLAVGCIPAMVLAAFLFGPTIQIKILIIILSASLFFSAFNQKWLFQGFERMKLVSVSQALKMITFAICTFIFVRVEGDVMKLGAIEVFCTGLVAAYFMFLQLRQLKKINLSFEKAPLLKIFGSAKFIAGSHIMWSLAQAAPLIVLAATAGAVEMAWFGAAYRITNAFISFTVIYHFNMYPTVTKRLSHSNESFLHYSNPSLRITAWGGTFIAMLVTLFSDPICRLVFGDTYTSASLTLAILIWIVPITLVSGHARWALVAGGKQQFLFAANMSGCIVCIIASLILAPSFMSHGTAMAMILAYLSVWLVAHYFAAKFVVSIPLKPLLQPLVATAVLLAINFQLDENSTTAKVALLALFIFMALFSDKQLRQDVPDLIGIKNSIDQK